MLSFKLPSGPHDHFFSLLCPPLDVTFLIPNSPESRKHAPDIQAFLNGTTDTLRFESVEEPGSDVETHLGLTAERHGKLTIRLGSASLPLIRCRCLFEEHEEEVTKFLKWLVSSLLENQGA